VECITNRGILVGQTERKRPLGRTSCKYEDAIKMNLKGLGCDNVGWVLLAQERYQRLVFMNIVLNLWVP
jgi:hypothetical protein